MYMHTHTHTCAYACTHIKSYIAWRIVENFAIFYSLYLLHNVWRSLAEKQLLRGLFEHRDSFTFCCWNSQIHVPVWRAYRGHCAGSVVTSVVALPLVHPDSACVCDSATSFRVTWWTSCNALPVELCIADTITSEMTREGRGWLDSNFRKGSWLRACLCRRKWRRRADVRREAVEQVLF
jgi:hypothetical protein